MFAGWGSVLHSHHIAGRLVIWWVVLESLHFDQSAMITSVTSGTSGSSATETYQRK